MIREALYSIDPNTMVLGLLFIIFFVFIQLVLEKSLKNKMSSSIIAFCISLLAVYGLNRTKLDVSGFFYNLGLGEGFIYIVIPLIVLAGLIYLFWKVKIRFIFVVVGILLIGGSFLVYEKGIVLILGIISLIVGIFLMWREAKRQKQRRTYQVKLR